MKKHIILFSLLVLFTGNIYSQVNLAWIARYNGPENDEDGPSSLVVDDFGNTYVCGYSLVGTSSSYYTTVKYNSAGVQQWDQRYSPGVNSANEATSIAVDFAGNVYVTGRSKNFQNFTGWDYATVKYNSAGVQQWVQRFNGSASLDDEPCCIAVNSLGDVFVTGYTSGVSTGPDYMTIKYNTLGVLQWAIPYDGTGLGEWATSMVIGPGPLENIYITGSSYSGSTLTKDYLTVKYTSGGLQQWAKRYTGPLVSGDDIASCIAVDNSENIYVTGSSIGLDTTTDYATVKYNILGAQQWDARYNGFGANDAANSLAVDGSGNVYVTGITVEGDTLGSPYAAATIKYNSNGISQWVQRFVGPGNSADEGNSIAVDLQGNIYVVCTSRNSSSSQSSDFATIKYDASGVVKWVERYNGPGNNADDANCLRVDASGNVYVTGISYGGSNYDFATLKYDQTVGIHSMSNEIPKEYSLLQNYPNPFNPGTKIKFDIPGDVNLEIQNIRLIIYDVLGKKVTTLVNQKLSPGVYEVEFNGANLTGGVYFYKLETTNFVETKRMVLVK